jgi:hypothetical protein
MKIRALSVVISSLAVASFAMPVRGAPIPVSACGTVVIGRGELVADLDCSAYPGSAVVLVGRSRLLLNGFSISANTSMQGQDVAAIQCVWSSPGRVESCKIRGPGTLTGGTIGIDGGLKPSVSDVIVAGAGTVGVLGGKLVMRRSVIQGNGALAVQYDGGGVRAASVSLRDCDVSGNARNGVWSNGGRLRLVRSSVTGNGVDAGCESEPNLCADLVSYETPRLMESICGTSTHVNHTSFGVCADD